MFTTKKMNDLVMVPLFLLATVIHLTECMVYHTAFLGRNFSAPIENGIYGFLQYQDLSEKPNVVDEVNCTWTPDGTMIKASSPECRDLIPDGFQLSSTGVKVESSEEFTLHVYQTDSKGNLSDGYLAIPDEHLGTEYYVSTYCSLGGHCQIAVAGTTDSTSLQIVFPEHIPPGSVTCNGQSITTGDPVSFKLNENEVLHIESNESQVDLSGTYITSDNVIAVFIGARDGPDDACMIEQIPPVNKWGTELVVATNVLNDAGDAIKIITQSADTTIHILRYSPFTISNAGDYVELRIDWEMHSTIVATKPILVVQIMSIDIYNDTSIVKGKPAMVLVPHVEQWTDKEVKSDCFLNASDDSILTAVADSDVVPWDTNMFDITQTPINGSEYFVVKNKPKVEITERITSVGGINRTVYGYCKGRAAVLLAANWLWNNEECFRTRPMPGDGVDNDCDGKVDEDNCTKDDLFVNFHSTPNKTSGEIYSKTLIVIGASPIHFSVTTCGVAAVTFKVANDQRKLFTAHISHRMVSLLLSCPGGCPNGSHFHDRQASSPCVATKQEFEIRWSITAEDTEIEFLYENGTLNRTFEVPGVQLDFDVMIMAAFSGSANFTVDLPEKRL
ncbi:uncharacterized protein LOC132739758 [Ruditapes philippinarum]|uniref:uncharacterized protein LOC132739758 n=1 Tax=Ruditapes philippinarum TaxID=129788 RepID=UPI00295C0F3B|nr:uncharacterized protein LOC132739758 [Ruditapes philippinarum]